MNKKQTGTKDPSQPASSRESRLKAAMKANITRRKAQAAARAKSAVDAKPTE